jgi:hypothetical protein
MTRWQAYCKAHPAVPVAMMGAGLVLVLLGWLL